MTTQCRRISCSLPVAATVSTASWTSAMSAIPVEQMIGLPRLAISRMRGRCHSSNEATLNALTPRPSSRSTASKSNGVERKSRPAAVAWSNRSACHSRGSSSSRNRSDIVLSAGRIESRYFALVGVSATIRSAAKV